MKLLFSSRAYPAIASREAQEYFRVVFNAIRIGGSRKFVGRCIASGK